MLPLYLVIIPNYQVYHKNVPTLVVLKKHLVYNKCKISKYGCNVENSFAFQPQPTTFVILATSMDTTLVSVALK